MKHKKKLFVRHHGGVTLFVCIFYGFSMIHPAKGLAQDSRQPDKVDFSAKDVWDVDIYNRDDHKVLVIHDRRFTKSKRFELSLDFGTVYSNPFFNNISFGGKMGYHLSEYIAVEGFANASQNTLNAEGKRIDEFFKVKQFETGSELQKPTLYGGLGITWSPIYGKLALFRSNIIYFDIYGILGAAVLQLESDGIGIAKTKQTLPATLGGVGTRIFFNNDLSLRIELKNSIYRTKYHGFTVEQINLTVPDARVWRNQTQAIVGLSYLIGRGE